MKKLLAVLSLLILAHSAPILASQDIVLQLAARTATVTSDPVYRSHEKTAHFIIVVTAAPGAQTITPTIQALDTYGNVYSILVGSAISATGTTVLKIGNALAPVANASAQDMIPDIYRVLMTHSGGGSWTYSVTLNRGE